MRDPHCCRNGPGWTGRCVIIATFAVPCVELYALTAHRQRERDIDVVHGARVAVDRFGRASHRVSEHAKRVEAGAGFGLCGHEYIYTTLEIESQGLFSGHAKTNHAIAI